MAFIDDLSTFMSKARVDITKKTKEISFSISNPEIRAKERELSGLYEELGKKYYDWKTGNNDDPDAVSTMNDIVSKVTETKEELEALEKAAREDEKRICPGCGEEVPASSNFCPVCGTKLEAVTRCPSCGSAISSDMTFCVKCGTKIEWEQEGNRSEENIVDNGEDGPVDSETEPKEPGGDTEHKSYE